MDALGMIAAIRDHLNQGVMPLSVTYHFPFDELCHGTAVCSLWVTKTA